MTSSTTSENTKEEVHPPVLSPRTMRKIERASGNLATASVAEMERRLPWFARMPADQRASVLLLIQNGVAGFVEWLHDRQQAIRLTADAFRSAPKDISRWVSLRQTVELVRIALELFEEQMPAMAADETERALLMEGGLRSG